MITIGIVGHKKTSGFYRLFNALGSVFGVHFEERVFGDDIGIDAWVLLEANKESLLNVVHCGRPCYIIIHEDQLISCGQSSTIEFSTHQILPSIISGRQIRIDEVVELKALPNLLNNITLLASKGEAPVWAIQEADGYYNHFVSLSVAELDDSKSLFQYFYGNKFISLLPILVFLRILTGDNHWEPPPLQACFMFDDPNLHWRTYGFIDFAEIKEHARLHNYHVAFATIPLDAWFVHKPTALFFRQHWVQLSLLIHGNDHVAKEFARSCSDEEHNSILHQALMRVARLERRSGVEVSKVMVPPHGACSESALEAMVRLGYEAVCVSGWSLRHYNDQAKWLCAYGLRPCEIVVGMTVIPRFRMSRTCHNNILVAALLRQPIIIRGHHRDTAEGLQLLGDLSEYINSLGTVRWADIKRISRSHYSRRYDGRILRICMFTKRIEIFIPEGINKVILERSWLKGDEFEPLVWRVLGDKLDWTLKGPDETIPVLSGKTIEIVSNPATLLTMDENTIRKFRIWPTVRRQLTEARDRVSPALRRFSIRSGPC